MRGEFFGSDRVLGVNEINTDKLLKYLVRFFDWNFSFSVNWILKTSEYIFLGSFLISAPRQNEVLLYLKLISFRFSLVINSLSYLQYPRDYCRHQLINYSTYFLQFASWWWESEKTTKLCVVSFSFLKQQQRWFKS